MNDEQRRLAAKDQHQIGKLFFADPLGNSGEGILLRGYLMNVYCINTNVSGNIKKDNK